MAGFVLVMVGAAVVGSVLWTIEKGRTAADPLAPRPWSELEGWACDHPEVPEWAWVDLPDGRYDLPRRRRYQPRQTVAHMLDVALDDAIAYGEHDALRIDAERRHEALMAAYAAHAAAYGDRAADDAALDAARDVIDAAKAGREYASKRWCAVLYA